MATNNSANNTYTNNADGFSLAGGTTPRTLSLTAGNLSLSAGGSNTYTFPAATGTLVSRDSTDTLTNKTLTDPVVNQFGTASGLGAAWSTWSPSYTNFSLGNGTLNVARYKQVGKIVFFEIFVTMGSTSSVTGQIFFTLPVTASSSYWVNTVTPMPSSAVFIDAGSGVVDGRVYLQSTTTGGLWAANAASTYTAVVAISATVPFTWNGTNNDTWQAAGAYEAA